jgi:hypothetical protein
MNNNRRRFLKILGVIGAGLLVGLPGFSLDDKESKASVPEKLPPMPLGGRFNSPRGGCTESGIALLDKGPRGDMYFANFV